MYLKMWNGWINSNNDEFLRLYIFEHILYEVLLNYLIDRIIKF